jgi:hypothetical protein
MQSLIKLSQIKTYDNKRTTYVQKRVWKKREKRYKHNHNHTQKMNMNNDMMYCKNVVKWDLIRNILKLYT